MKRKILKWIETAGEWSTALDNILFVIISHGAPSGGVRIGGETLRKRVSFLTVAEVKQAAVTVRPGTYFTVINTCCHSGHWLPLATDASGNTFIYNASAASETTANFRSKSGKLRGGVIVTALLNYLKRDEVDGTLSEFVAEVRDEVLAYNENESSEEKEIEGKPCVKLSAPVFWNRKLQAFIPSPTTVHETLTEVLESVKSTNIDSLFISIKPAKRRRTSDELISEFKWLEDDAERRGYSNGEDIIYEACQEVLDGDASYIQLLKTMIRREKAMLQAQHILHILINEGFVSEEIKRGMWEKENALLTQSGSRFYEEFEKSEVILRTQTPPEDCIGGPWFQPLMWLSNMLGEWSAIDVYSAREAVEAVIALMNRKGQEAGMGL
jgi:hypothetical protein